MTPQPHVPSLRGLRRGLAAPAVLGAVGVLALSACGSSGETRSGSSEDPQAVTVFAAASMTKAGDELAAKFKESHPEADIKFNYAGSSALVQQIDQGATPDIFISADQKNMDKALELSEFSDAGDPKVIATNTLQLVTAADNPAHIESIQDVSDDKVAVCAPEVPCGTLAKEALDEAGVTLQNPTEEANVSAVSTKISQGAVDAGFIYSTDAKTLNEDGDKYTAIDLEGIEENEYPLALTNTGEKNDEAKEFSDWLSGDDATEILKKYGFGAGEDA